MSSILNLAAALERVGGDSELLSEIAGLFLEEAPTLLDQLRRGVAAGNAKEVEHAAHSLKGSVANFEASGPFEAALRLEVMGRHGDLVASQAGLKELEAEMDRLTPALRRLVGTT